MSHTDEAEQWRAHCQRVLAGIVESAPPLTEAQREALRVLWKQEPPP